MFFSYHAVLFLLALFLNYQIGAEPTGGHSDGPPAKGRPENREAVPAKRKLTLVERINAMDGRLTDEQLPVYERFIDAYLQAGGKDLVPLFQEPNLATRATQTAVDALKKNAEFAKLSPEEQKKELEKFFFLNPQWRDSQSYLRNQYELQIEKLFTKPSKIAATLKKMVENANKEAKQGKEGAWAKLSSLEAVLIRNGGKAFGSLASEAGKAAEAIHKESDGPPIRTQLAYILNKLNQFYVTAGTGFQKAYEAANQKKHVSTKSEKLLADFKGDKDFDPTAWRAVDERARELKKANEDFMVKSTFSSLSKAFGQAIVAGPEGSQAFEAALQTSGMPPEHAKKLIAQGKSAGTKAKSDSQVGEERLMAYLEFYLPLAEQKAGDAKRK